MTVRAQPEFIAAPITPRMAEGVETNFEYLFQDLRALETALGTAITPVAGGVCYSTSSVLALTAAGTSGYVLVSQGTSAPIWQIASTAVAHDMLSATHTDALAAAVARGALIVGNSTPKWAALALGTAGKILRSDGSDLAYTTATYPTTTSVSELLYSSSANVISGLTTGLSSILATNGSGVPAWGTDIPTAVTIGSAYIYRVSGTDVSVADGGTGLSTLTIHALYVGNGTSAPTALAVGATGKALIGATGADPAWDDVLSSVPTGLTYTTATRALSLTSGYMIPGGGSAGQVLQSAGASAPTFSTATYPATAATTGTILRADGTNWVKTTTTWPTTTTANQILFSSATSVIGEITTGNSGVLVTNGTGVPSIATDIPTAVTIGTAYIYRAGGTDVAVADGGTNLSSYTVGDILHATATGTIGKLADVAVGQVLCSGGVGAIAAWSATPSVTMVTISGTVTNPTDAATKEYVDIAVSALELTEFLSATASDIGGYYVMDDAEASSNTVTSAAVTGTGQLLLTWATLASHPGLDRLIAAVYDCHLHLKISSTGATITAYFELYSRTSGGVETLLGTSETVGPLTDAYVAYTPHLVLSTEVALNTTDRVVIKLYGNLTAGASTRTVSVSVGGTTDSHFSLRVSASDLAGLFLPYTGAQENVNTGTYGITTAYLQLASGGALRTGTSAGNTVLLQAYDTDTGPGYVTFATLTAGTAPTCDLSTSVTMGGAGILTEG